MSLEMLARNFELFPHLEEFVLGGNKFTDGAAVQHLINRVLLIENPVSANNSNRST